jgi:hypothetical protein
MGTEAYLFAFVVIYNAIIDPKERLEQFFETAASPLPLSARKFCCPNLQRDCKLQLDASVANFSESRGRYT